MPEGREAIADGPLYEACNFEKVCKVGNEDERENLPSNGGWARKVSVALGGSEKSGNNGLQTRRGGDLKKKQRAPRVCLGRQRCKRQEKKDERRNLFGGSLQRGGQRVGKRGPKNGVQIVVGKCYRYMKEERCDKSLKIHRGCERNVDTTV